MRGNWLDLVVATVVLCWIVWDIEKDGFARGGVVTSHDLKDNEIAVQMSPPGFYDLSPKENKNE